MFRSVLDDDGNAKVDQFADVTTVAAAGTAAGTITTGSVPYYYCSIYTATFSLVSGATNATYTLIYDNTKLTTTNEDNLAIAPALRIGIYLSNSQFAVVAPFNATSSLTYVTSTSATDTYTGCLGSGKTGTFELSNSLTGTGTVAATIYTWFEGTDSACINNNVDTEKALTVGLSFRITENPAA